MIFNVSGGGAGLNFAIAGGTVAPTNPRENTIWVDTDIPITGWSLSFNEPSEPEEGMVWIVISATGNAMFNAMKKNTLTIAPMAAKQYVNGAYQAREAQIYIEGEWKDLVRYMVKDGRAIYPLKADGKSYDSANPGSWSGVNVVPESGYVSVSGTSNGYGIVYVDNVDLTATRILTIDGTFDNEYKKCKLLVWNALGAYITSNVVRSVDLPNGIGAVSLDVSGLTGPHIVGISSISMDEQQIANFWLE